MGHARQSLSEKLIVSQLHWGNEKRSHGPTPSTSRSSRCTSPPIQLEVRDSISGQFRWYLWCISMRLVFPVLHSEPIRCWCQLHFSWHTKRYCDCRMNRETSKCAIPKSALKHNVMTRSAWQHCMWYSVATASPFSGIMHLVFRHSVRWACSTPLNCTWQTAETQQHTNTLDWIRTHGPNSTDDRPTDGGQTRSPERLSFERSERFTIRGWWRTQQQLCVCVTPVRLECMAQRLNKRREASLTEWRASLQEQLARDGSLLAARNRIW